jgi:hypothetical protein
MGERVFDSATSPKRFVQVAGAGHDDVLERGLPEVLAAGRQLVPEATP